MLKTLINKDEVVESHKHNGNQFSKVDKITKKELVNKNKPIDPKFIFDKSVKKKKSSSAYRKPTPDPNSKKPIISLDDWGY